MRQTKKNDMCIHERSSTIEHIKIRILRYTMNSPISNHNYVVKKNLTTTGEFDDGSEIDSERLGKGKVVASKCGCALHLRHRVAAWVSHVNISCSRSR